MAGGNTKEQIMGLIDHTLLKPYSTLAQLQQLVDEAAVMGCYSICVNPVHVPLVRVLIAQKGYRQKLCSVIDFPFGASTTDLRVEAVRRAALWGADEVDVVAPTTHVKSGLWDLVDRDLGKVVNAAHGEGLVIKVIVEDAYTTRAEKESLYRIVMESGADFIKTGTGFEDPSYASAIGNQTGARVENVRLMAELSRLYNPGIGIKPAGGVRNVSQVLELLAASGRPPDPRRFRVGTSSARKIYEELSGSQRI
ncbi:MAG: deoxyribose-phosphate aldolase [Acidilobus sp.]